jgi:hypothetical protein
MVSFLDIRPQHVGTVCRVRVGTCVSTIHSGWRVLHIMHLPDHPAERLAICSIQASVVQYAPLLGVVPVTFHTIYAPEDIVR